jgi:hypothetical protein
MRWQCGARKRGDPVTNRIPAPAGGVRMETFVPLTLKRSRPKTLVITPDGTPSEFPLKPRHVIDAELAARDSALMRALGLAHHWQRLLDEQRIESAEHIAAVEGIAVAHVRRFIRMTLMAPKVLEALTKSREVHLEDIIRRPWPNNWEEQMLALEGVNYSS